MVAVEKDQLLGHVVFTKVTIAPHGEQVSAQILAPLAIVPDVQNRGVGGKLIAAGLEQLKQSGVELVFVLGHPDYYPRSGFTPAGRHGLNAPYLIPEEHAAAWMVQALRDDVLGRVQGDVKCSDVLNQPEHWQE